MAKKNIIWSNYNINPDNYKDYLDEMYPDITDEYEKYSICVEDNWNQYEDEKANLNKSLDTDIVVIGDLGLWNGRVPGYKELNSNNLADCLQLFNDCDYGEFYVDKYKNLRSSQSHHDGNNSYLYRRWKPNISDEQKDNFLNKIYIGKCTSSDIARYTISLGKDVCDVYGW